MINNESAIDNSGKDGRSHLTQCMIGICNAKLPILQLWHNILTDLGCHNFIVTAAVCTICSPKPLLTLSLGSLLHQYIEIQFSSPMIFSLIEIDYILY